MIRSATRRRIVLALMCALMLLGAYLAARPLVADLLWQHASAAAKEEIMSAAAAQDDREVKALLKEAADYNAKLAQKGQGAHELTPKEKELYLAQLGGAGTSQVMGAVEIPALGLVEKICFGTSETALMAGLGHCEWSSLPIGGSSTHCVLAGHSGMENHRMLDNAPDLKEGDHIYLSVLGKTLSYEVTGLETVLPSEVDTLTIEPERDLLTLVTCVPYGVNSHRLLVHCERCDHPPEQKQVTSLAALVVSAPARSIPWIRVLPVILVIAIIAGLALYLRQQGRRTERSRHNERKVYGHRRRSRCGTRLRRRYRRRRRRRKRLA